MISTNHHVKSPVITMSRKGPKEIVKEIFDMLETGGTKTTHEIAHVLNSNTQTVRKYAELIEYIQSREKLVIEKTTNITFLKITSKRN